jgi:hypothetical protein
MISDIQKWMPAGGDEPCARQWLTTQVKIYGDHVVADSYAKLGADLLSGKIITRPLQTWCAIAARMRDAPRETQGKAATSWAEERKAAAKAKREKSEAINAKLREQLAKATPAGGTH